MQRLRMDPNSQSVVYFSIIMTIAVVTHMLNHPMYLFLSSDVELIVFALLPNGVMH